MFETTGKGFLGQNRGTFEIAVLRQSQNRVECLHVGFEVAGHRRERRMDSVLQEYRIRRQCVKIAGKRIRGLNMSLTGIPDALLREAAELWRQNRLPEAIDAYRRVLARFPGLAQSWF